jgi:urease accessory protein
VLEDGGIVAVRAKPEELAEIHAHDDESLIRIAWHLGNRHLPVQFVPGHLRIRRDHVIEDMVEGLGGHVDHILAPFDPEAGAYAGGHQHAHDDDEHDHDNGRGHDHSHEHGHHH